MEGLGREAGGEGGGARGNLGDGDCSTGLFMTQCKTYASQSSSPAGRLQKAVSDLFVSAHSITHRKAQYATDKRQRFCNNTMQATVTGLYHWKPATKQGDNSQQFTHSSTAFNEGGTVCLQLSKHQPPATLRPQTFKLRQRTLRWRILAYMISPEG